MSKNGTPIIKSEGINLSEMFLTKYCERTFLKLWAYPNPYGEQRKELCDVLAVFEEHIFIFSIKDISFNTEKPTGVAWERWKRKAIDDSIRQVKGAERWIRNNPEKIFLDAQCTQKLPIPIDTKNWKFHRIVVAFGAEEACKNDSPNNINGSLAIGYTDLKDSKNLSETLVPFGLVLPRDEVIHVFDSHNLAIILGELDTVRDLLWYFEAKETAIKKYKLLQHCGEEDLLAHYLKNLDKKTQKHYIGSIDKEFDSVGLEEGLWEDFINSGPYKRKKKADEISYAWDGLLQMTLQNALDGTLTSDGDVFKGESAMIEMAKEPRFMRRENSKAMLNAIGNFPDDTNELMRHLGCYPSFYHDRRYVFLLLSIVPNKDYKTEYRPVRIELLKIACGVAKNEFPHLKKIIGIAMEPPKPNQRTSEDFILMDCENWTEKEAEYYKKENKEIGFNFFGTKDLKMVAKKSYEFPPEPSNDGKKSQPERNQPCPCGSGKKYKKCCYMRGC